MGKRKAPGDPNNVNQDFCEFLTELADYEKNVDRNVYKYNAYRKAARVLASHPTRITSGAEAKKLNGVGEKIAKKIDEFLQTGKLQKLENIHKDDKATAITVLAGVSGIGAAKAAKLVQDGITTIEDLKKHKDKLTHHQLIGLKYYEDFQKKIPREEVHQIEDIIREELEDFDPNLQITVCGSYRRGKTETGDIDILITHPDYISDKIHSKQKVFPLRNIIEKLEKRGLITDTLSLGELKFMGVCKLKSDSTARRLDIRFIPFDQYFCGILYFTGSDVFNQQMRAHAVEQGFTLNEYTLRPLGSTGTPGEPLEINSEEDIFDIIDYPYKKPEERS